MAVRVAANNANVRTGVASLFGGLTAAARGDVGVCGVARATGWLRANGHGAQARVGAAAAGFSIAARAHGAHGISGAAAAQITPGVSSAGRYLPVVSGALSAVIPLRARVGGSHPRSRPLPGVYIKAKTDKVAIVL